MNPHHNMHFHHFNPTEERFFPGFGFGIPFLTGLAAGALLTPGYPPYPYPPYPPYPSYYYPPYPPYYGY
jgi:hypothetical protein